MKRIFDTHTNLLPKYWTVCPFCGDLRYFTAVRVNYAPDKFGYYVTCDYKRGGCGGNSGWYDEVISHTTSDLLIADELDYQHRTIIPRN